MMNDLQDPELDVNHLVSGIIADSQKLIQQHFALLRSEVRDDLQKTKIASLCIIWGAAISLLGCILLAFMLVELLSWAAPELSSWACYGIVGVPIVVLGCGLFFMGMQKFKSIHPLPDQSVLALKETMQWKTNLK